MTKKDLSRRLSAFRDKRLFDISSVSWRCSKEEQVKFPFHYLRFPAFFRSFLLLLFFSFLLDQKVSCLDLIGLALKIWQDNWIKSLKTSFQNIHTEREESTDKNILNGRREVESCKGFTFSSRIDFLVRLFRTTVQDDSSKSVWERQRNQRFQAHIVFTSSIHGQIFIDRNSRAFLSCPSKSLATRFSSVSLNLFEENRLDQQLKSRGRGYALE